MEQLLDIVIWFAIAYMTAKLLTSWLMDQLTREIREEIEDIANRLDSGKLIPVTVEVDQNQYFCYNAITQDFVCQGFTLEEIAERFSARFPEGKLALYNGDKTALETLKKQMEESGSVKSSV